MSNDGELLKKYLKEHGLSAYSMAELMGMQAPNIYYHLKKQEIDPGFKQKLALAGHNVFNVEIKAFYTQLGPEIQALQKKIEFLEERLKDKEETISALRGQIEAMKS